MIIKAEVLLVLQDYCVGTYSPKPIGTRGSSPTHGLRKHHFRPRDPVAMRMALRPSFVPAIELHWLYVLYRQTSLEGSRSCCHEAVHDSVYKNLVLVT